MLTLGISTYSDRITNINLVGSPLGIVLILGIPDRSGVLRDAYT